MAAALIVGSLLGSTAASGPSAAGLPGQWRLVEQHYERGEHNLVDHVEPHHIEVRPGIDRDVVRTWTGPDAAHAVGWPAVFVDGRAIEVETVQRTVDLEGGVLRATYRVNPGVRGGQTIDVVEEYRWDSGTDALVGTITFRMSRDGAARGGYVLRRRYERTQ